MDEITIIAVGIDAWETSSAEMEDSIFQHEPGARVVFVDNAAPVAYHSQRSKIVRLDERVCMSAAMNAGARGVTSDWLVFANNDLTCTGPFLRLFAQLRGNTIYGNDMLVNWWNCHHNWLDGWIMAVPRKVWETVGEWDENFTYAGFEDADYCIRAEKAGFTVAQFTFPFVHRELHSRFLMPNYMAKREDNIAYLCEKWGLVRQ